MWRGYRGPGRRPRAIMCLPNRPKSSEAIAGEDLYPPIRKRRRSQRHDCVGDLSGEPVPDAPCGTDEKTVLQSFKGRRVPPKRAGLVQRPYWPNRRFDAYGRSRGAVERPDGGRLELIGAGERVPKRWRRDWGADGRGRQKRLPECSSSIGDPIGDGRFCPRGTACDRRIKGRNVDRRIARPGEGRIQWLKSCAKERGKRGLCRDRAVVAR